MTEVDAEMYVMLVMTGDDQDATLNREPTFDQQNAQLPLPQSFGDRVKELTDFNKLKATCTVDPDAPLTYVTAAAACITDHFSGWRLSSLYQVTPRSVWNGLGWTLPDGYTLTGFLIQHGAKTTIGEASVGVHGANDVYVKAALVIQHRT